LFHHEKLPNLKVLNISHLSEMVNETFCSRLVNVCFNLEEVDLSGCAGLDDDCIAFFNESNLANLKVLKFDSCPLISALTGEILNLKYNQ
jgi:Leucine-rich repeat (LRR) protein